MELYGAGPDGNKGPTVTYGLLSTVPLPPKPSKRPGPWAPKKTLAEILAPAKKLWELKKVAVAEHVQFTVRMRYGLL
jgi:hypothetical protein